MFPRPINFSESEEENLPEDGITPLEQPADLIQNVHNIQEPNLYFEYNEQQLYFPVMFPP